MPRCGIPFTSSTSSSSGGGGGCSNCRSVRTCCRSQGNLQTCCRSQGNLHNFAAPRCEMWGLCHKHFSRSYRRLCWSLLWCWDSNITERALLEYPKGYWGTVQCFSSAARCSERVMVRCSGARSIGGMQVAVTWTSRDGCTVRWPCEGTPLQMIPRPET